MYNPDSLSLNADLIINQLRQKAMSPEIRRRVKTLTFRTVFVMNLPLSSYIGYGFIQSLKYPKIAEKAQISFFQENITASIIFVTIAVISVSLILAYLANKISDKIVNTSHPESESQLNEIKLRVRIADEITHFADETGIEIAEAYIKNKTERLKVKADSLTILTLVGAFLNGTLAFLSFNEFGANFIGSCAIWILLILRLDIITKLFVYKDWLEILSIMKSLLKRGNAQNFADDAFSKSETHSYTSIN